MTTHAKIRFKKVYRKAFYPLFKQLEKRIRTFFFLILKLLFPRFNAFRVFGIPSGVSPPLPAEDIFPPSKEKRTLPHTIDQDLIPCFSPLEISTPGGKIALLKNGFTTATAATLTEKGKLVAEFTEQFTMGHIDRHKLFTFRLKRCFASIPHFDGLVASLTVDGQWNYYHWLFDVLPKIHLLRKKGFSPNWYYGDTTKPFQKESLSLLGIEEDRMISPHTYPAITASSLLMTSFPCKQGIPRWVCTFLQHTFLPQGPLPSQEGNRIFISRKDTSYRRILNEEELLPLLRNEGFTIVQPERMSFKEQISLFQGADFILAPHGAGLANLVFAKPGTTLVEIFPPRFPCTCYWALSNLMGIEYFCLKGIDDPITYSSECEGYDHLLLDIEKFNKILSWAFQKKH